MVGSIGRVTIKRSVSFTGIVDMATAVVEFFNENGVPVIDNSLRNLFLVAQGTVTFPTNGPYIKSFTYTDNDTSTPPLVFMSYSPGSGGAGATGLVSQTRSGNVWTFTIGFWEIYSNPAQNRTVSYYYESDQPSSHHFENRIDSQSDYRSTIIHLHVLGPDE
jgi:hypothetical protein